jgi:Holliday junction resolvase RusA-like endonuclease
MPKIEITIPGIAATQRPRIKAGGRGLYNVPAVKRWKEQVKTAVFLQTRVVAHLLPIKAAVPVSVIYNFYLPWAKGTPKKLALTYGAHPQKPDLKNLLTHTEDALSEADLWVDDSQADTMALQKWRCPRNEARVEIVIAW